LIDRQGRVRAEFAGELNWKGSGEYKTVARRIEALRVERVGLRGRWKHIAEGPYGKRAFFARISRQAV